MKQKFDILKDILKDTTSVRTPADARWQITKKLLAKGKISEATFVMHKMDDMSLLEKNSYMSKETDTCKEWKMTLRLSGIQTLKQDEKKVDTNLIYAMNCGAINSGPSYLFKTSQIAAQNCLQDGCRMQNYAEKPVFCHWRKYFMMVCTVGAKVTKH